MPQVPLAAPAAMLHTSPVQQSPVAVQAPADGTQTMPPSWVLVRHRSVPVESGTQGERLQHSAALLQVWPGWRQQAGSVPLKIPVPPSPLPHAPEPRQRGRPKVSKAQHCALGETTHSQSLWALAQALVPPVRRQIPPGTWLPWFWEQTPMLMLVGPVAGLQVTSGEAPAPPQHSLELVHKLLRILQPSPGWQTLTPVSAHGPQLRLQQLPQPLQRTPSCWHCPAPVVATSWHTPEVAPVALEQKPPQQSRSRPQTSPG